MVPRRHHRRISHVPPGRTQVRKDALVSRLHQPEPAFLACGEKDRQDIAEGLAEMYLRFKRAGASAELHVYAGVGHGFGLRDGMKGPVAAWPERFAEWLDSRALLTAKK